MSGDIPRYIYRVEFDFRLLNESTKSCVLIEYPDSPVPNPREYVMSADDGVYVLVTRGRKTRHGYKKEYRVVSAQCIENVTEAPDYPFGTSDQAESHDFFVLNCEMVLSYFGGARVFNDRRIAEGYAQCLEDHQGAYFGSGTEYGIVWMDYSHIRFPIPQRSGRSRRFRKNSLTSVG